MILLAIDLDETFVPNIDGISDSEVTTHGLSTADINKLQARWFNLLDSTITETSNLIPVYNTVRSITGFSHTIFFSPPAFLHESDEQVSSDCPARDMVGFLSRDRQNYGIPFPTAIISGTGRSITLNPQLLLKINLPVPELHLLSDIPEFKS